MKNTFARKTLGTIIALASSLTLAQESDMPGSRDFQDMPRVDGTHIVGFGEAEYDSGAFVAALTDKEATLLEPEGRRTRILYVGTLTQTPLQMIRNYQRAFASLGDYQEIYACREEDCPKDMAREIVWAEKNRVPTLPTKIQWLYHNGNYREPIYVYGTITNGDTRLHVSVFSAIEFGTTADIDYRPVVHVEILEEDGFQPTLTLKNAAAMSTQLDERGSVTLDGILFDFESSAIQAESREAIAEIAKLMTADPALEIYVVGHTDSEGTRDYNLGLSADRAAAVVSELSAEHGIAADRMTPVGIGPVAPIASNDTDAGRELNRRVQMVKR